MHESLFGLFEFHLSSHVLLIEMRSCPSSLHDTFQSLRLSHYKFET